MREAAEIGRGTFTYIGDIQETKDRIVALFQKLENPAVTGLDLKWESHGGSQLMWEEVERFPSPIPDLYVGEPVTFSLKLKNLEVSQLTGWLAITGQRGSEPWHQMVNLETIREASGVAKIWARKKIAQLTNDLRRGKVDREEYNRQIVSVALAHQLVTPQTSLVAVGHQAVRPPSETLRLHRLATNLPAGWKMNAIVREQPLPGQIMPTVIVPTLVALALPPTATLAQIHLLFGWLLFMVFFGTYFVYRRQYEKVTI